MFCEQAETLLFDYVDDRLNDDMRMRIGDHLEVCKRCRTLHQGILDMQAQARVWHDVAPPQWRLPRVPSRLDLSGFGQWFPSLASAVALILVIALYVQQPGQPAVAIPAANMAQTTSLSPVFDDLLQFNREQRQQELGALVRLLKAEMDRRSLETAASLRYVITHQIQEQRELDDLSLRIRQISQPTGERM